MKVERFSVAVTTAADGSATVYSPDITGELLAIHYVKTNFTNGVDFTITAERSGETLWTQLDVNASVVVYPRVGVHDTAGVAALYAAGGVAVRDRIALALDRVKIVIASGGNATTGTFVLIVG